MTLSIRELYPDSWRIDHANFAEVAKTTFAKGTIKEFQKLQGDPVRVASLVKVSIGGQANSAYLPLFFCPKKQYWDQTTPTVYGSQDFNQNGKYYEVAWMSFRCDDEVVVMLQEGTPIAVLGFADGFPRVGEDIYKIRSITGDTTYWGQVSTMTAQNPSAVYEGGDNGPDGKSLNLSKACEIFLDTVSQHATANSYDLATRLQITSYAQIRDGYYSFNVHTDGNYYYYAMAVTIKHYLVPIGPKLFIVECYWTVVVYDRTEDYIADDYPVYNEYYISDPDAHMSETNAAWQEAYDINLQNIKNIWGGVIPSPGIYRGEPNFKDIMVQGAVYSKDLYDTTKANPIEPTFAEPFNPQYAEMNVEYPDFEQQTLFTQHLQNIMLFNPENHFKFDTAILVHPHDPES